MMSKQCFCFLMLLQGITLGYARRELAAQPPPPLIEYLPKSAGIYLGIGSVSALKEKAQQTDLAKILKVDGIREYVEMRLASANGHTAEYRSPWDFLPLLGAGGGKAAVVVVERPRAFAAIALLVDTGDSLPKYQAQLTRLKESADQQGFSQASVGVPGLTAYEKKLDGGKTSTQCWFESRKFVCIANDLALAKEILAQITSTDPKAMSLAAHEGFGEIFDQCQQIAAPDLWFYAEPLAIAQLTQQDPDDNIEPKDVMTKHGLHQLKAMAATLELAKGNREIEYDFFLRTERPYVKSMQLFELAPVGSLAPPAWLDEGVNNVVQIQWKVRSLPRDLAGLFDDIVGNEGTFAQMLEDLKSDVGPGVDLQKDLFDNLDAPILISGRNVGPIGASSEHTIIAVKVSDGKGAEVATAIKRLFVDDSNAVPETIQSIDLWKIGGKKPIGGGKNNLRFKSTGIMVAQGYLFMSSNVDGLRRLLGAFNVEKKPVAKSAEYARAKSEFGAAVDEPAVFRLYYSLASDTETSYELLRKGKIQTAESIYAQLLTPLIQADRKNGFTYEFSKLPDFKSIRHLFGTAFANGVDTDKGWKVHGFVLKNAASQPGK